MPWVEQLRSAPRAEHRARRTTPRRSSAAVAELDACGTAAVGEVTNTLAAVRRAGARAASAAASSTRSSAWSASRSSERVDALQRGRSRSRCGPWPTPDLAYAPRRTRSTRRTPTSSAASLREARERGRAHEPPPRRARRGAARSSSTATAPSSSWFEARLKLRRELLEWPGKSPGRLRRRARRARAPRPRRPPDRRARRRARAASPRAGAPVVFCPRSNLYIETRLPPLLAARAAGLLPALGTDSLASNASLDVLAEARALADRFPTVPAARAVRMATWNGARALGREDVGRIARGARPGLVAIDGDSGRRPVRVHPAQREGAAALGRAAAAETVGPSARLSGPRLAHPHVRLAGRLRPHRVRAALRGERGRPRARRAARRRSTPLRVLPRCSRAWSARERARWRSTAGPIATSTHEPADPDPPRPRGRRQARRGAGARRRLRASGSSRSPRCSASGRRCWRRACSPSCSGTRYAKRFTWGAHAWLGVALALAPGGAWLAMGAASGPGIVCSWWRW